jgi:Ankyrin repeats (3 copies)/Ankyrin repeats (many copies)
MMFTARHRFRWVFCQLEALRYCFPPSVRHMLEELPETLDETYERILREINKANRSHAHRLLQCLTVAIRPLRVAELAEIVAVDFGMAACGGTSKLNTDWRWADQQQAVLSTCSSLISIVDEDGFQVVQFSHFSVKEFLTSSRLAGSSADVSRFHILLKPAHTILAKACLGVLLRLGEHVDEDNVEKSFPLARYAAEYWVDHAQFEDVSYQIREEIGDLFDPDKPYFAAWLLVHDIDTHPPSRSVLYHFAVLHKGSNTATPLYYAALCGFRDIAEHLIMKHPQQVDANGGHYASPLGAALGREHLDVAQLLYEHGADIDIQGNNGWTPLYASPSRGHREIVEWLLSHGADPNFCSDHEFMTPLHEAVMYGEVEISRILLQHKADPNAIDYNGQTPLHESSERGHINVARLLLEHGVDVNAQDHSRSTALHLASRQGKLEVACLLLEHGADRDAEDNIGRTAFQVALRSRHHDIAKLLSK